MGCVVSNENSSAGKHMSCVKDTQTTNFTPTSPVNELEVDLSHFSSAKEILGIGGFGIVRRVVKLTCHDAGNNYALKSISKQTVLSRPSGTRAVMTELKALIMISHCDHICALKYAFQDESFLYMVIEYASGGDMRYNLRKAPQYHFSESISKLIIRQVIMAVQHCHNSYILHRDVKPENILLFEDGRVKITDFGVAKVLPDIEQCRSTSGTHGYMAPEIYADDHTHGTAFDWFCVGITLHEFLSGRRPYEATRLQRYYANDCIDRLELDYLQRMPLSPDCISFVREILRPDPMFRLGGNGGEMEIYTHPWMIREKLPINFLESIHQLRAELPAFNELFENKRHHVLKRSLNKMNVSRDEAANLVRQHQELCVISADVQNVFRDFEYNIKVSSPILPNNNSRPADSHASSSSSSINSTTNNNFHRVSVEGAPSSVILGAAGSTTAAADAASSQLLDSKSGKCNYPFRGLTPQCQIGDSFDLEQEMNHEVGPNEDKREGKEKESNSCGNHGDDNSIDDDRSHGSGQHNLLHHYYRHVLGPSRGGPSMGGDGSNDAEEMKMNPMEPDQQPSVNKSQQQYFLRAPNEQHRSAANKRTRNSRPQSDRIVNYRQFASESASSSKQPSDHSLYPKERYKPQRRLSFPSPNMEQDDYPYDLYEPDAAARRNPNAISWRKVSNRKN